MDADSDDIKDLALETVSHFIAAELEPQSVATVASAKNMRVS